MINYTTRYLNVRFGAKQVSLFPYPVKEGEVDLNGITVTVTDIEITADSSATVKYTHSDGNTVVYFAKVDGQQITFPIVTTTEGTGTMLFEINLYIGSDLYKSATYKYEIVESLGYINISGGDMQLIQQIALAEQLRVEAEELRVTEHANRLSQMQTATTNAQNATANANAAADNCYEETTIMVDRINNAISAGTVDLETKLARVDMVGFEHPDLKTRLTTDFDTLSNAIPKNLSFNGIKTITADNTISGNVNNGVASGETLVNLATSRKVSINAPTASTYLTIPSVSVGRPLIGGQKFTVFMIKKSPSEATNPPTFTIFEKSGNNMIFGADNVISGVSMKCFTYDSVGGEFERFAMRSAGVGTYEFDNIVILEGDHTDKPLEFFEGLKSAEISEVETHGVNLVDFANATFNKPYPIGTATPGDITFDALNNLLTSTAITGVNYSKWCEMKLKPSTKYRFVGENVGACRFVVNNNGTNGSGVNSSTTGLFSIETTSTANGELFPFLQKGSGINGIRNLAIYEVTPNTPTDYTPYESTKLTTPEPVILRSLPNGTADTLDLETGELTRRCGEVVLNGSESWGTLSGQNNETTLLFTLPFSAMRNNTPTAVADKLQYAPNYDASSTIESIYTGGSDSRFYLRTLKSKLTTPDITGFKAWLQANPTTVVYQLATSTTEIIDLDGYLKSHDIQTTITAPSVIPAKLSFDIPVSLKHWLEANSLTNQLLKDTIMEQQIKIEEFELFKTRLVTTFTLLMQQLASANPLPAEEVENLEQKLQGLL